MVPTCVPFLVQYIISIMSSMCRKRDRTLEVKTSKAFSGQVLKIPEV
jgi:hypothetical protein